MKSPIEQAMDRVEWTPFERTEQPEPGSLFATHEGVMNFGAGIVLRCYQLSNGQMVFDAEDVEKFFGIK